MVNLYTVFPPEIWADILEELDDSEDILNIVEAYPQLQIFCQGKEYCWLIGEILPLIIPKYLPASHIFVCRLVSKRWNNAISNVLESHPDRLPYKSCKLKKITEHHFSYHKLPNISTNLATFAKENVHVDHITKCPFPGGRVILNEEYTSVDENSNTRFRRNTCYVPPAQINFRQTLPLLKIYGHHICHLHIKLRSLDSELINGTVEPAWIYCLSCLPNLKSLKITGLKISFQGFIGEKRKQILEFISKAEYPFQLEIFDILDFFSENNYGDLSHSFITSLAKQDKIQKLVISAKSWKSEYGALFPNLCELCLYISKLRDMSEAFMLQSVLHDLRCSPIRKLKITTGSIDILDILEILAEYRIECLEIVGVTTEIRKQMQEVKVKETLSRRFKKFTTSIFSKKTGCENKIEIGNEEKVDVIVPSIKYLSLRLQESYNMWFTFLHFLPCLEGLTVDVPGYTLRYPCNWDYEDSKNCFFECLKNFHVKHHPEPEDFKLVWKQFPNLRKLILHKARSIYQYFRECENTGFCLTSK